MHFVHYTNDNCLTIQTGQTLTCITSANRLSILTKLFKPTKGMWYGRNVKKNLFFIWAFYELVNRWRDKQHFKIWNNCIIKLIYTLHRCFFQHVWLYPLFICCSIDGKYFVWCHGIPWSIAALGAKPAKTITTWSKKMARLILNMKTTRLESNNEIKLQP